METFDASCTPRRIEAADVGNRRSCRYLGLPFVIVCPEPAAIGSGQGRVSANRKVTRGVSVELFYGAKECFTAPENAAGQLEGLIADLGTKLARQLGVPFEAVEFASPLKFVEAAGGDVWDITLMTADPSRAKVAD